MFLYRIKKPSLLQINSPEQITNVLFWLLMIQITEDFEKLFTLGEMNFVTNIFV